MYQLSRWQSDRRYECWSVVAVLIVLIIFYFLYPQYYYYYYYYYFFLTLGRYDPEEILKITDKQKGYDQSAGAVIIIIIISQKPMNGVSPNFGHRCIWLHRCAD